MSNTDKSVCRRYPFPRWLIYSTLRPHRISRVLWARSHLKACRLILEGEEVVTGFAQQYEHTEEAVQ